MAATSEKEAVARASGDGRFATTVAIGADTILSDEPPEVGGGGDGPTPYQLLSAALAACTSMTLRLYAHGKGWALPRFDVAVVHSVIPGNPPRDRFDRRIAFREPIAADRLAKLIEMADRCPVHRTLSRTSEVVTSGENDPPPAEARGEHFRQMEQACAAEPGA